MMRSISSKSTLKLNRLAFFFCLLLCYMSMSKFEPSDCLKGSISIRGKSSRVWSLVSIVAFCTTSSIFGSCCFYSAICRDPSESKLINGLRQRSITVLSFSSLIWSDARRSIFLINWEKLCLICLCSDATYEKLTCIWNICVRKTAISVSIGRLDCSAMPSVPSGKNEFLRPCITVVFILSNDAISAFSLLFVFLAAYMEVNRLRCFLLVNLGLKCFKLFDSILRIFCGCASLEGGPSTSSKKSS